MLKNNFRKSLLVGLSLILALTFAAPAQTKRKPAKKKLTSKADAVKIEPVAAENKKTEIKKNSRPVTETPTVPAETTVETVKTNRRPAAQAAENQPIYFYEFAKPEFVVSKLNIEHDENGRGRITLQKKDFADPETDPLQLSAATLERLKTVWQALNFLDSTETYQAVRDYSHLGTMKFSMRRDGRIRSATFNWTDNVDAKRLADEYRKIGQQFVWVFDINVARENQPLDAPRLLDALDALIRRDEVSDQAQMIPLLKELSNDERIPLIARNRATKLVEKIEKSEKKK